MTRDFRRLRAIKGWSALRTLLDVLLFDSGFQALALHRIAHTLRRWGVPGLPSFCRRASIALCGVDILPAAQIGGGCYLPHGVGVVVGGSAIVGEDCTILQGVTIGEGRFDSADCPRIGNRVTIGAGATLLGRITVGDGASVGAGAVVLDDVPVEHVAVGVPATSRPAGGSSAVVDGEN